MDDAKSLPATPWDFRMRALVIGIIYAVGFGAGITLQFALFFAAHPTYALIGARGGLVGIHAAAFIPVLLTFGAQAIRMWGTAYLSSGVVWSASTVSGNLLLAGPYRYVRNPLYLGNIVGAIGIGMIGPPIAFAIIVGGVSAFALRLINVEERYLTAAHGAAYRDYCALVPKLLPRLIPAPLPADPRPPAWADAFWGEFLHLALALAALYNALFTWQNPNATMWIVFVAALAVSALVRRLQTGLTPVTP